MIERIPQGKVIWINLKNPTPEEVKKVMKELDLSPSLMNDLTAPVPRNYATLAEDTIKIVLDFPVVKRIDAQHPYEVKFLVSARSLVTVQYEEMGGLDKFKRQAEVASTLHKTQKKLTGADLCFSLINQLYENTFEKLNYLETKLTDIEGSLFKENEKEMVFAISDISKKIISFRHTLTGHCDIFEDAQVLFRKVYKDHYESNFISIFRQYEVLTQHTNMLSQTLTALRDTNTAMLYTKQNEVMKIFTIMAFVTFPLTLLSSMFGMNVQSAPIVGSDGDFWIITVIMVLATIGFFFFFKKMKWI
jgi:magnesium transporter